METITDQSVTFYDFLGRMRHPASLDLVRSIKSFLVSFSFHTTDSENNSKKVQDFFLTMEAAFRDHPLWANATEEDIGCSLEGLEKYVMTKLFPKSFASSPEDVKIDQDISDKIRMLQTFLRPEHLDIPLVLHNQASWLLAEKELVKINAFKAPREKLLCIMNCCKVINNLLLKASISENHMLAGADDFLPLLIYVTVKANPPYLHSNLKFIQLFRKQAKLVSEAAYYFTNLASAKAFIVDLTAKSLSIEETDFEDKMQAARSCSEAVEAGLFNEPRNYTTLEKLADPSISTGVQIKEPLTSAYLNYPYMEAEASELTIVDVETLLCMYKDVVAKYSSLCKAVRCHSLLRTETPTTLERTKAEESSANSALHRERTGLEGNEQLVNESEEAASGNL